VSKKIHGKSLRNFVTALRASHAADPRDDAV